VITWAISCLVVMTVSLILKLSLIELNVYYKSFKTDTNAWQHPGLR
jgi:hypothetical protein